MNPTFLRSSMKNVFRSPYCRACCMPLVATLTTSFSRSSPDLGLPPPSLPPPPPPPPPLEERSSLMDRERALPIPLNPPLLAPMESGSRLTSGGEFLRAPSPPPPPPLLPPKRVPPLPVEDGVESLRTRPLPLPLPLLYSSLMQVGIESVEILLLAFGREGVAPPPFPTTADEPDDEPAVAAAAADGK